MCEHTKILGVDRDGAFAQYVAVPESVIWQNDRAKLPPEIATLQEPFGNAVFALSHEDVVGEDGGDPRLRARRAVQHRHRARVRRRAACSHPTARRSGSGSPSGWACTPRWTCATSTTSPPGSWSRTRASSPDVVFEMSGAPQAIGDAFSIVRNGGRVILFGIPAQPVEFDVAEALIFKNLTVSAVSGREVLATWYKTRWLLEHGVVDLRPLITEELDLAQFERAFALLESGEACKIVLHPNGAPHEAMVATPTGAARSTAPAELGRWAHR